MQVAYSVWLVVLRVNMSVTMHIYTQTENGVTIICPTLKCSAINVFKPGLEITFMWSCMRVCVRLRGYK